MRPAQWQAFTAMFARLSQHQRHASIQLLSGTVKQEAVVTLIEQTAHARAAHLACPACHSTQCHRHGQANGLQRYRCVPCGRTFNCLTGTPLARLRYKSQWLEMAGAISWRCHALSAELSGLALDTGREADTFSDQLAQGRAWRVPTFNGDIA